MYHLIKKFFFRPWMLRYERLFRAVLYLLYAGFTYRCNCCGARLRSFIHSAGNEWLCPLCGSLPRDRRLWQIISPLLTGNISVLHLSPSRCIDRLMKNIPEINYVTSDFSGEFNAMCRFDLTAVAAGDNSFDIIICYHILEHIEKDFQAMKELYRILKPHGKCFVQTPFTEGAIVEDFSVTDPALRKLLFGQHDHVRWYSTDGLRQRLQSAGFTASLMEFTATEKGVNGFKVNECIIIANK